LMTRKNDSSFLLFLTTSIPQTQELFSCLNSIRTVCGCRWQEKERFETSCDLVDLICRLMTESATMLPQDL
jgi:hypothetical protein